MTKTEKLIDLAKPFWLKEENVLSQVRREYEQWFQSIQTKRRLREKDLKNYVPTTKKNKININTVYTTIQTLMSVYYTDKMVVNFKGRKEAYNQVADNLTRMAEFDYDEMDLENIDYQWNWDRFFFWVGIKIIDWWNKETSTPISKVISPLSWIPDPRGWFSAESHRWAWFEVEDSFLNLKYNKAYSNVWMINGASDNEQENIRLAYQQGRSVTDQWFEQVENKKYPIYHHYTCIDWYKYLVTTANNHSLIIRMIKLEPVTKEEKANPLKVPFPIALKYYSPIKCDPFGVSIPDLLRDKQDAESRLFNLAIQKEIRNVMGDDLFYNPKKIGNVKMLTTPSVNPKAIPVKVQGDESISNLVYRLPKESQANAAFNASGQLQFQNALSTGIDANSLWVTAWAGQTATEAQLTQKNANLRFILWTKTGKWWEATFWKLWKRSYIFNLKPSSKKTFYITKTFNTQYFEFKRKDLITKEDVDIQIISSAERESLQQKQKADFFSIAPQLLADPSTPKVSKNWIKRHMLRLSNMTEEQINIMQPKTIDEMQAEVGVADINRGDKPVSPKEGEDHLTYIYAFYWANDCKEKYEAIEERVNKFIEEGGEKAQLEKAQALAGWDNTLNNIAASNASQLNSANIAENSWGVQWNLNASWI